MPTKNWDKRFSGKSKPLQQPVHQERYPGHISAVLQQREDQEQHGNLRQKAEHSPYSPQQAVCQQALQPLGRTHSFQQIQKAPANQVLKELLLEASRSLFPPQIDGNHIYCPHKSRKNGNPKDGSSKSCRSAW